MQAQHEGSLSAGLQTACALCRSFLGPCPGTKCVITPPHALAADTKSILVDSPVALLHAADGEPTATTLLLEALEAQVYMCVCVCLCVCACACVCVCACRSVIIGGNTVRIV